MNKIHLIGRLSSDVELRYTNDNKSVANFNLAVSRKFKNSKGEYETDFFTCKAFGKLAETLNQYIKKGDKLGLTGSVYFSKYKDKDGNNRTSTQVSIDEIDFIEPRKAEAKQPALEEVEVPQNYTTDYIEKDIHIDDNDLPF